MSGPVQHFYSSLLDAWRYGIFAKLSERKGFLGAEYVDFTGSLQLLTPSHLRERDKMLLRTILCGRVWNGFLLGKAKKEDVPCRFCGKRDGDGHLFWECTFPPSCMFGSYPSLPLLCPRIVASGPVVCFGMAGCLGSVVLVRGILGRLPLGIWLVVSLSAVRVLILWILLLFGPRLDIGMLMILLWKCLILLTFGRMVVRKTSPQLVGLRFAGAGVYVPAMLAWSVVELPCLFLELCRLSNVPNSGVPLLPCRRNWPCHLGIDSLNVARTIGRLLDRDCLAKPLPLGKDGDLVALTQHMIRTRGRETVRVTKVKGLRIWMCNRVRPRGSA